MSGEPRKPDEKDLRWLRVVGECSMIPVYLALYPVAFRFIGLWLDQWLGTSWLAIAFLFLGLFSGFRQTYFALKRLIGLTG